MKLSLSLAALAAASSVVAARLHGPLHHNKHVSRATPEVEVDAGSDTSFVLEAVQRKSKKVGVTKDTVTCNTAIEAYIEATYTHPIKLCNWYLGAYREGVSTSPLAAYTSTQFTNACVCITGTSASTTPGTGATNTGAAPSCKAPAKALLLGQFEVDARATPFCKWWTLASWRSSSPWNDMTVRQIYNACTCELATTTSAATSTSASTTSSQTITAAAATTPTDTVADCTEYYTVVSGDDCAKVAAEFNITTATFEEWNPSVGSTCAYLDIGYAYCVAVDTTDVVSTTSTSAQSTSASTSTAAAAGVTASGITASCTKYLEVVSGDTCYDLSETYDFTVAEFETWNSLDSSCLIQANVYYCIAASTTTFVSSAVTSTTTSKTSAAASLTSTASAAGATATGITASCTKYLEVVSGDTCYDLSETYDFTLAEFEAWNSLTSACNIEANVYYCIAASTTTYVASASSGATATSGSTASGTTATAAAATATGIVSGCTKYVEVVSGDTCYDLSETYGFTLAEFEAWNSLTTACDIDADTYYCIDNPSDVVTATSASSSTATAASVVLSGGATASPTAGDYSYYAYNGNGTVAAGWPALSSWATFEFMWEQNLPLMNVSCQDQGVEGNTPTELQDVYNNILNISTASGVDERLILAVIMEESTGCVRVKTTTGSVPNPGLMQDHDGTGTCNDDGDIQYPCPNSEIYQMIKDGTEGTASGDGVEQCITEGAAASPASTGVVQYYRAARIYNGGYGSLTTSDLGDGCDYGASCNPCYSSDVANRVRGWAAADSPCEYPTS